MLQRSLAGLGSLGFASASTRRRRGRGRGRFRGPTGGGELVGWMREGGGLWGRGRGREEEEGGGEEQGIGYGREGWGAY